MTLKRVSYSFLFFLFHSLFISLFRLLNYRFLQNKSFWPSITENRRISCYDFLCSAFESAVYEQNLARALQIQTCRVIPYFKFYIEKLKKALSSSKTFSFTSGSIEEICAKVNRIYLFRRLSPILSSFSQIDS